METLSRFKIDISKDSPVRFVVMRPLSWFTKPPEPKWIRVSSDEQLPLGAYKNVMHRKISNNGTFCERPLFSALRPSKNGEKWKGKLDEVNSDARGCYQGGFATSMRKMNALRGKILNSFFVLAWKLNRGNTAAVIPLNQFRCFAYLAFNIIK